MSVLTLSEFEFAVLYLTLLLIAGSAAALLRWVLCKPHDDPYGGSWDLNATEVAYLAGGVDLTLGSTVAALLHRGVLVYQPQNDKLTLREHLLYGATAEERVVLGVLAPKAERVPGGLRGCLERSLEPIRQRLLDEGLLVPSRRARWACWSALLLVAWVPLVALAKLAYDLTELEWDKALALIGLAPLPALVYIFGRRPHRTNRGDTVLRRLRHEQAAVRYQAERQPTLLSGDEIALVLALYGLDTLRHWPMARDLQVLVRPRPLSGGHDGLVLFVAVLDRVVESLIEDEVGSPL